MSTNLATAPQAESRARRTLDRASYERFLPLVRRTAMRVARRVPSSITVADLVGYGWLGLMEAYQRVNEHMPEHEFEAYAVYRIRGAMLDYLRTLDPATRELRRTSRRVTLTIRDLTRDLGRAPEEEEIAGKLGVSHDAYRTMLGKLAAGGMARLELLDIDEVDVAASGERADDGVGRSQLAAAVAEAIEKLPPRLIQVIALYYQEECTLREIGEVLGVTESRVSQLHTEAIHRLRAAVGRE